MALPGLHITRQEAAVHECQHGQHFWAGAVFFMAVDKYAHWGWALGAALLIGFWMIWREDRIIRRRIAEGPIYDDPLEPSS
jgi:hypothetical protein